MSEGFPPTWLTLTLDTDGVVSWVDLEHVGVVPDELWAQFGPSATGIGWDLALHGLDLHIVSGQSADHASLAEWMASPDEIEFMTVAGQAWSRADAATGASPDDVSTPPASRCSRRSPHWSITCSLVRSAARRSRH